MNYNQNPVVKLSLDKDEETVKNKPATVRTNEVKGNIMDPSLHEVSKINSQKRVVSKYVEITTKVIYTYEDGSKKEIVETENHTFNN